MFLHARGVVAASLIIALGVASPLPGLSADSANAGATKDRNDAQQKCDGVAQDSAACVRETRASAQERRSDGLTDPEQKQQQQNATARCADQPIAVRAECEARMNGAANSKSDGSVAGGGIIRETITPASSPR